MKKRPLVITGIVVLCLVSLHYLSIKPMYYINLSNSAPKGIYKLIPFDGHLKPGDMVIFDPPEKARPYVYGRAWMPTGWPMLKTAGAITGDEYQVTHETFSINNRYIGPVYSNDSSGNPVSFPKGRFLVQENHFLPISTHIKRSFDGRYFGQVPLSLVRGKAKLVLKL